MATALVIIKNASVLGTDSNAAMRAASHAEQGLFLPFALRKAYVVFTDFKLLSSLDWFKAKVSQKKRGMCLSCVLVHAVGCSEAALQPAAWTLLFLLPLINQSQSLADQSVCM